MKKVHNKGMANKPEIFLESHNINNKFTGFGQFNYWLIKNLIQYNENLNITLTARKKDMVEEFLPHVQFKKYHTYHRKKVFAIRKKYDLWHSLNQNSKVEPYHSIPYILTIHDVIFMEEGLMTEKEKNEKIKRLQKKIDRASAIVYISEYTKSSTHQYFEIKKDCKEYVIYNGNPVKVMKTINLVQSPNGLKKPFLFSLGQFMEKKNFHTLIGMLAKLNGYQLVLGGNYNHSYKSIIDSEIKKYKLEEKVIFPGKISEEEKHFYLQNCEAFVFPSLHEGFGMPPIEAMAYGKPVFLANRTSLPEIGGKYAFYWDHFEAEYMAQVIQSGLQTFYSNPEFSEKIAAHVSKFDWSSTAREYLKVYKEVLNCKKSIHPEIK